jgi:hypothetical protein
MPHLHLPAEHTDADLVLAGQVAELMESAELYVTWTPTAGLAAPEVDTLMREPVSPWAEALSLLVRAATELWVTFTRPARPALQAPARTVRPSGRWPHPAPGESAL